MEDIKPYYVSKDGNFTLYNGDCVEIMKELKAKVNLILADPPYELVGKIGELHIMKQSKQENTNSVSMENMSFDTGFNQTLWLDNIKTIFEKEGGHLIIFNDWENMGDLAKKLRKEKVKVREIGIYQKTNPLPCEWKRRFVAGREYFLFSSVGSLLTFNVHKVHNGVFLSGMTSKGEKKQGVHPTQKPLKVIEEIISILTIKGDMAIDPFLGSGTTSLACKKLNRKCIGIELSKEYCDLAIRRYEELCMTGSLQFGNQKRK